MEKLHAQTVAALNSPELRKSFEERVIQPVGNTPEEFGRYIQVETKEWKDLVAKAGLKIE